MEIGCCSKDELCKKRPLKLSELDVGLCEGSILSYRDVGGYCNFIVLAG